MEQRNTADATAKKELTITRRFNVPRALVFKAWTDPEHASKWWGPGGFTNPVFQWDARTGGAILVHMKAPDGVVYPMSGMFTEVTEPGKIVMVCGALDDNGNRLFDVQNSVELTEHDGGTMMVLHAKVLTETAEAGQYIAGMEQGWKQSADRLSSEIERMSGNENSENELVLQRVLDAPRELVFKVWTNPESLAQWWGPKGFSMRSMKLDLRPGGVFHYCMSGNGFEMWGRFVYHEISAPEKIIFVSSFADKDGNILRAPISATWPMEVYNILTLTEHRGKTTLTLRGWPLNATAEEQKTFNEGRGSMQQGFAGTFEQLEAFLAKEQE